MKPNINRERLADCFTALAHISSPSFAEDAVFAYVRSALEALGCEAELQDYGRGKNLIAYLPATDPALPALALAAHADTVEPCAQVRVIRDGDRLSSDGTTILGGDDKAAIAEIIEALAVITENHLPHGRIEVIVTSAEEVGLVGAKHLDMARIQAAYCLVLDSSGEIGSTATASPYHTEFVIEFCGKKAHAGIEPEKGASAIAAQAQVIHDFPTGRLDAHSVANFGSVKGGGANNIVPDHVVLTGEIRSHDKKLLDEHCARLLEACRISEEKFKTKNILTVTPEYDGFSVAPDHPLIAVVRAAAEACGLPFSAFVTGGGSDANIISARGVSCLNLACGMHAVHTNEEYVLISEMEKMSALLVSILCGKIALIKS
ncbi:MAG: M20/M25/M40 family metallo-hydrolase [Spirochaetota bacterium]|jgi:tripeptide aminopeptidase|nr:M20/M25/M40 family metallo-hydrolase [Spirochaetota bacterium]